MTETRSGAVRRQAGLVFGTGVGLQRLFLNSLAAFGALSGLFQFYSAVWVPKEELPGASRITVAVAVLAIAFGLARAWPRRRFSVDFRNPGFTIELKIGDVLAEPGNILIGFSDTFDTDISDDVVIHRSSVQGQLTTRLFGGSSDKLDRALGSQLSTLTPIASENQHSKKRGNLDRYEIGSTVAISQTDRKLICTAYTEMGNDLVCRSSVEQLWTSLSSVWEFCHTRTAFEALSMPVIGSELARITALDREGLIRLIVLSFVGAARAKKVSRHLTVVVWTGDAERINMLGLQQFVKSLR